MYLNLWNVCVVHERVMRTINLSNTTMISQEVSNEALIVLLVSTRCIKQLPLHGTDKYLEIQVLVQHPPKYK